MIFRWIGMGLAGFFLLSFEAGAGLVTELKQIGVIEKLGQSVSKDLTFVDEKGQRVRLGSYFDENKPVVLVLSYYGCPSLCTLVLNHLAKTLASLKMTAGNEFEIVTVSIDPGEKPELAAEKRKVYLALYGKPHASWSFLTSPDSSVQKLSDEVGFNYWYDKDLKEYIHTAVVFILKPDGQIFRYFYGMGYTGSEVELALLEAAGTNGWRDRVLLYFYRFKVWKNHD